jgi:hypothetical protein
MDHVPVEKVATDGQVENEKFGGINVGTKG